MHTVYCWRCGHAVVCTAEVLPLYLKGDVRCPRCGYAEGFAPADDHPWQPHHRPTATRPGGVALPARPTASQRFYQAA